MGDVTIGVATYAIYGTDDGAGADTYLAAKIGAADWAAASSTTKYQALVSATRAIQNYLMSQGFDEDPADDEHDTDEIASATYELANAAVVDSGILDKTTAESREKRVKAGSAEVEYFRSQPGGRFPAAVQSYLNSWISSNSSVTSLIVGAAYGTTEESTLESTDYDVSYP